MRNNDDTYMEIYGCTHADLVSMMNTQMKYRNEHFMLAMSILSDAQEAIAHNEKNMARQFINRAKFVMREWHLDINPTN
jgi:hypothetical protein